MATTTTTPKTTDTAAAASVASATDPRHGMLRGRPVVWASVGILQTLLSAGIVFGWASLLPIFRSEGVSHTPQEFATIFTCGAIGNYLSTLLFGVTLDRFGPRITAILASILFGIGLILCCHAELYICLLIGFGLLGFAGPGIQMPTLHLANLFSSTGSAGAVYMSSQAAAFDGGTVVFAIVRYLFQSTGLSTAAFFYMYLIVPITVLMTAIFVWPNTVLEAIEDDEEEEEGGISETLSRRTPSAASLTSSLRSPYIGTASSRMVSPQLSISHREALTNAVTGNNKTLVNAPLSTVLKHPSFWTLAVWVSVHILKLNFVVATLNDQLYDTVGPDEKDVLIDIFGAMLPFGFVALPLVAWLLNQSTLWVIQLANTVGLIYGAILVWFPFSIPLLSWVVFPAVATSRQMVYSTVFHQIGAAFGFVNYGVLLGLTNILVSTFSLLQTPLVNWSENQGDYTSANTVLLLLTVPLFFVGFWANPKNVPTSTKAATTTATVNKNSKNHIDDEERVLLIPPERKPRSYSSAQ